MNFLKITILGGFVFLIPLVMTVVVLGKAFQIIKVIAQPLDRIFPNDNFAGSLMVDTATIVLMLGLCLLAGFAARSSFGQLLHGKFDGVLLRVFPGYGWIKSVASSFAGKDSESLLKPVLARFDDQSQIGFEMDRSASGLVAVYIPGVPDPRAGTLSYLASDRVQSIEIDSKDAIMKIRQLGRGSAGMLGEADTNPGS